MSLTVDLIRAKRKSLHTGFVCVAQVDGEETLVDIGCLDTQSLVRWLEDEGDRGIRALVLVLMRHATIHTELG